MRDWFFIFRPWSYTATIVPFLIGGALAGAIAPDCRPHACLRWALGLASGLLFQATVNLLNTWGDERSGVDAVPGAVRTTPQVHEGKISMCALFTVAITCLISAVALGIMLCFHEMPPRASDCCDAPPNQPEWRFCWTLLAAGIVGALGSINYSTGIKFKYHGLGVPFVSFLMGPLEMFVAFAIAAPWAADRLCGRLLMHFAQNFPHGALDALAVVAAALLFSLPVALLVGVIMHGNDMRDIHTDRAAGIVTLASRLGPRRAIGYYRFCHAVPYATVVVDALFGRFMSLCGAPRFVWLILPCLALPLSLRTMGIAARVYRENPESPKWRGLERASGLVHLVFGVLYAVAVAKIIAYAGIVP